MTVTRSTLAPSRGSMLHTGRSAAVSFVNEITLSGHYNRSRHNKRVPTWKLRRLSQTIAGRRALNRITNGVLNMSWNIEPPAELKKDPDALAYAAKLRQALLRPNREDHNLYEKLVSAIVDELCVLNVAAVERQAGGDGPQPFWIWPANAVNIHVNPEWTAALSGLIPRYYDYGYVAKGYDPLPIMSENMFLIQRTMNTYELVSRSPMEIAYDLILSWLGLGEFQTATTSQAVREYIIHLKNASQEDVDDFREYWRTEVEGSGEIPIIGGEDIAIKKAGARNDEELYLKYNDYLLRMIALAFDMASKDYNIQEHDNRATAEVAADATFQDAVLPMARVLRSHFQEEIIEFYAPGFKLVLTDTERRSEHAEATTAALLFEKNVITRNRALQRLGEEPVGPAGEMYFDGSKLEPDPADQDAAQQIQAALRRREYEARRRIQTHAVPNDYWIEQLADHWLQQVLSNIDLSAFSR